MIAVAIQLMRRPGAVSLGQLRVLESTPRLRGTASLMLFSPKTLMKHLYLTMPIARPAPLL